MNAPEFKKVVLSKMHEVLKPNGFRKSGSTFSVERNDVVQFVQLQSSMASTRTRLVVTVNLGVFLLYSRLERGKHEEAKSIRCSLDSTHRFAKG
jgi:hypothetical protein